MKTAPKLLLFLGALVLSGIAAGLTASTIRFAGPIQLVRIETLSSTEYETVRRYATINDALADIGGGGSLPAGSSSNRYQIRIPPGEFDLGGNQIVMESFVDIVGSGQESTIIICACGSVDSPSGSSTSAAVVGANGAVLRDLAIVNTGSSIYSTAVRTSIVGSTFVMDHVSANATGTGENYGIVNSMSSPTITNSIATGSGGSTGNFGVMNTSSASPTLTNVTASASGGNNSYGIANYASSTPTLTDMTVTAENGTNNFGIYSDLSTVTMTDVTAIASGGSNAYGIRNNSSWSVMTNVTATAKNGSNGNQGVSNLSFSHTMTNVTANASGGTGSNTGLLNFSASGDMTNVTASAMGGTINYGVANLTFSSPNMTNVVARAQGGATSYAVYNYSAAPTLINVAAEASGATDTYGLYIDDDSVSDAYSMVIRDSRFDGDTNSLVNADASGYTLDIGGSLLDGPVSMSGGIWTCTNSTDSYTNLRDADCVVRTVRVAPGTAYPTITSALDDIGGGGNLPTATAGLQYTVLVGPGTFNEQVTMEEYVNIVGAGNGLTNISCSCSTGTDDSTSATVIGASNASLQDVVVVNDGGSAYATAIYNNATSNMNLINVVGSAFGATTNYGAQNQGATVFITDGAYDGSGGTNNFGIYNNGGTVTLKNTTATATGGSQAIALTNAGAVIYIDGLRAAAVSGTDTIGISNSNIGNTTIYDSVVSASGGTNNWGIYNSGGTPTIDIHHSNISGTTYSVKNDTAYIVRFGASQMSGAVNGSGTFLCGESYGAAFAPLDTDCVGTGSLLPPAPDGDDGGSPPAEPPALPAPGE